MSKVGIGIPKITLWRCEICGRFTVMQIRYGEWGIPCHDGCLEELAKKYPEHFKVEGEVEEGQ